MKNKKPSSEDGVFDTYLCHSFFSHQKASVERGCLLGWFHEMTPCRGRVACCKSADKVKLVLVIEVKFPLQLAFPFPGRTVTIVPILVGKLGHSCMNALFFSGLTFPHPAVASAKAAATAEATRRSFLVTRVSL